MSKKLIIVLGPTAVGKTDFSIELAQNYNSPIISCDSRQIFKELKIGTAAPSREQLEKIKHYFIYSNSITELYTAGRYEIEALALLDELFKKHDTLIMSGGSCMYVDALCYGLDAFPDADMKVRNLLKEKFDNEGLDSLIEDLKKCDPESYEQLALDNPRRVIRALEVFMMTGEKYSSFKSKQKKERPFEIEKICLSRPREELYERINARVDIMINNGLLDEAKSLLAFRDMPALNTVGYKEIFEHLDGNISLSKAIELIKRNSRHYAKKQMTWWRDEPKYNLVR